MPIKESIQLLYKKNNFLPFQQKIFFLSAAYETI